MYSSPKFTVPQSRLAISGFSVTGWSRSSGVIPTAPPVVHSTTMSHFDLTSSIAFRKTATSCVGEPSSWRTWRWRTAAPASQASKALCAISSGVTGRAGCDSRVVSAPVTAQVMMTLSLM